MANALHLTQGSGRKRGVAAALGGFVGQSGRSCTVARYNALADIERGYRVLKSDIEIPTVHHRLPDRIRAHALTCFLALVLCRVMCMRLKAKGHAASPRTALDMPARIHCHQARIAD